MLEALLAYWLSFSVLLSGPKAILNSYAFPLMILLAKGERLALAPISLGFLYTRLDECIVNVAHSLGCYDMVPNVKHYLSSDVSLGTLRDLAT